MSYKLPFIACILFFSIVQAYGNEFWLPIVASEKNLTKGMEKFKSLDGKKTGLSFMSSDDCSNLKKGYFLLVSGYKKIEKEAQVNLAEWKNNGISDAYIRKCEVVRNSRLDLDISLIDDSLYERPDTIVNWNYEDALSYTKELNDSIVAVVQPNYHTDPEDIREGLRIKVNVFLIKTRQIIELEEDCMNPEFSAKADVVAVSCVRATMAENLLHTINIYKMPYTKSLLTIDQCSSPRIVKDHSILCDKEILSKDGKLSMSAVEFLY
ncbi:MAG: hypothetical protein NTV43_16845 [Methylococcales bacterium]|nr:hypothetical protein [Methylococcales bacterium]